MYLDFYGLLKEPFHITPDPEFLYLSPSHKEALGVILYGVENRAGFMMITGGVGLGKTTILRSALQRFDHEHTKTILVFNPCLAYGDLIKLIYEELGIELPEKEDQFQRIQRLHLALIEEYKQGNNVVLVIDEAQNMPSETLENLRMLSNLETSKDKLLQIILVGQQPELENLLNSDALRQLKQRIAYRATLVKLTPQESEAYIRHRLEIALGVRKQPFTPSAIKRIVKHCDGVPRCINIVCGNALISGFGIGQDPIKPGLIREVINDLSDRRKGRSRGWILAPFAALLIAGVLFYFYAAGIIPHFKEPGKPTNGAQETANVPKVFDNAKESPESKAVSNTVEQVPPSSPVAPSPKPTTPSVLNSTATPAAPNRESPSSPVPMETARPTQPSVSTTTNKGSRVGTQAPAGDEPPSHPMNQSIPLRETLPPSGNGMASSAGGPSDRPAQGTGAGTRPFTESETAGIHEQPHGQTPTPAREQPPTAAANSTGVAADSDPGEKSRGRTTRATPQASQTTKAEPLPQPAAPSQTAPEKPSAGSPDPSEIIDWLIDKRVKQKGARAN